jgi:hypothetical protein
MPPFLAIRRGISFWVEDEPLGQSSATLQAIEEGVFRDLELYDSAGMAWPVVDVSPLRHPGLLDRVLPWRRVKVRLRVGEPVPRRVQEIAVRLREIIEGDSGFDWEQGPPPEELAARFQAACSPSEIIQVARQIE